MNTNIIRVIALPAYKTKLTQPYNWLLYSNMKNFKVDISEFSVFNILFYKYDIFHLHWPEWYLNQPNLLKAVLKVFGLFMSIAWLKIRGTKIIWTAHNVKTHEEYHPEFEKLFWNIFLYFIDGYISLSYDAKSILLQAHPHLNQVKGFVVPLGHYLNVYRNSISKGGARQILGLPGNAIVFLFIGSIGSYKNVLSLIRCFNQISDSKFHLVVAGRPITQTVASELQLLSNDNSRIHLYLQFIPNDEIQNFLNAADLVVLPFQRILNSSSVLLSLSFYRPVLVPAMGSLRELQESVGDNWLYTYSGEISKDILLQARESVLKSKRTNTPDLKAFDWIDIASHTLAAYNEIL